VSRAAVLAVVLALCLASRGRSAERLSVTDLLDRYAAGEFEAVAAVLATPLDFKDLLKQLTADGPAWTTAKGNEDRERRELAAATFALEAARADEWNEWSRRQRQPPIMDYVPPDVFTWGPPPLLIEWGCQLFGRDRTPRPVERLWQLAALAVAERAEDADFLVGIGGAPLATDKNEVFHLKHALARFPNEPRFRLAHGIALEWRTWPQVPRRPGTLSAQRSLAARTAFEALQNEEEIAAEVSLRLGVIHFRQRQLDEALKRFERVESSTRDPYVVYLARYFTAQVFEVRGREADAMRAYGRALATVPHAQSAALPFAALLFKADRRADAYAVVEGALGASPLPADPWRGYADADDRFWPVLLARLHALIHR
jgi:tetratricopeptide (TPR) repeat protein